MKRAFGVIALVAGMPLSAIAHQLVVFASVDCETITVEAKFSNGKVAQKGDVRIFDGENLLLTTLPLTSEGTARVFLNSLNHSTGLVVEVDTGGHDNYWIITPEDISRKCGS